MPLLDIPILIYAVLYRYTILVYGLYVFEVDYILSATVVSLAFQVLNFSFIPLGTKTTTDI